MLDEFPEFWFLIMAIVPTVARLIPATVGLIGMGDVTEAQWDAAARATAADLRDMAEAVEGGLRGFGFEEAEGFAAHFNSVGQIIDEANDEPLSEQSDQAEDSDDA